MAKRAFQEPVIFPVNSDELLVRLAGKIDKHDNVETKPAPRLAAEKGAGAREPRPGLTRQA